jgi:hypothetical protein
MISFTWMFDSPKGPEETDPTGRLFALADAVEPFGNQLLSLDAKFRSYVDILYHLTPQRPNRITGEFEWFQMPATLMRRFVNWNLDISYETIWFDHSDSENSVHRTWLQKASNGLRKRLTKNASK